MTDTELWKKVEAFRNSEIWQAHLRAAKALEAVAEAATVQVITTSKGTSA